jgi:hypothetical protein
LSLFNLPFSANMQPKYLNSDTYFTWMICSYMNSEILRT